MEASGVVQFKDLGLAAVLVFAAIGSAIGTGIAGMAAIGAWKKAFMQNKAASFLLVAFAGAPLTQTIYGMVVMNSMTDLVIKGVYLWSIGIFCGIGIGFSAVMQGKAAAVACDALGETGKGFGNYIAVIGIVETVALFVMAFSMMLLGKLAA
ncbi:MAG: V-type ATP synthase subunit K [Candidatus Omnitrophica bacterium]|jgi:V/A-type H+-transporting ATPase subunit K|nr:V-type ATP synthase subunit K [Candidatus Omnitrophota bacterium]MDD5512605.1 V-type ATP synthase subunit K [Candidatus Omnitrophota bacterium]